MYATLTECLHARSESPDGIYFIEGNTDDIFVPYSDIYRRACHILKYLQSSGLAAGSELVFQIEDNKAFIEVFWAALLGGIVPVPLAVPRNDEQCLKVVTVIQQLLDPHMISDQKDLARVVEKANALGAEKAIEVYGVRLDFQRAAATADKGQLYDAKPDDVAFIQFSSGSTGSPKGVVLTHANLISNIYAIHEGICSPKEGDSFLSWMPLTHDMGLIGFHLTPMLAGWSHWIMTTDLFIRRPLIWLQKISEYGISFSASPNFGYSYLLGRIREEDHVAADLSSLRIITNGAEPISAEICRRFTSRFASNGLKSNVIFPVYGLAEASLAVSFSRPGEELNILRLSRSHLGLNNSIVKVVDHDMGTTLVGVGRAVKDCCVLIVNPDNLQPQPDGVVGMIHIRGKNVTKGYYTNERQAQNNQSDDWLDTGDIGFIESGSLFIVGRAKEVIFLNGQNYYSSDLERALEEALDVQPGRIVVSSSVDEFSSMDRLLVFVLHKKSDEVFFTRAVSISRFINRQFGINVYCVLPVMQIPKTTSGKVQRHKLVRRFEEGLFNDDLAAWNRMKDQGLSKLSVLPRSMIETDLAEIWRRILKTERFGVHDNFFEAGGNSLKAAEMIVQISEAYKVALPLKAVYDHPTIEELSLEITCDGTLRREEGLTATDVKVFRLSREQHDLYYWWKLNSSEIAYNIPIAIDISGALEIDLFESAISRIIARHDTLRSRFIEADGVPFQQIEPHLPIKPFVTVCQREDVNRMLVSLVQPFDLATGPLLRVCLLTIGETEHVLFLDFHHIISDGISLSNFILELLSFYEGHQVPELGFQYQDYRAWETSREGSANADLQKEFWLKHFSLPFPKLCFPSDAVRPPLLTYKGKKIPIDLKHETVVKIREAAMRSRVTPAMLTLAVFGMGLSKFTGQRDIVIGVPVARRRHSLAAPLIGMFVRSVAIRCTVDDTKDPGQLASELQEFYLHASDNSDFHLQDLIDKLDVKRDVTRNLFFDTMFIYQNMDFPSSDGRKMNIGRRFFDPGISKYDLSLEVFEEHGTMSFYLEYNTSLFRGQTMQRFASYLSWLFDEVAQRPDIDPVKLSLAASTAVETFAEMQHAAVTDLLFQPVTELFEKMASAHAERVAIYENNRQVSYAELLSMANAIADELTLLGIQRGDAVMILLDRSVYFISALFAVLKAGCFYVPVDPVHPVDRIAAMMDDCRPGAIVTSLKLLDIAKVLVHRTTALPILTVGEVDYGRQRAAVAVATDPGSLAYAIYTSGTTGKPKGVAVEHAAFSNYLRWAAATYAADRTLNFAFFTQVSVDLTITSIFLPLITGGAVTIYGDDGDEIPMLKIICDERVNALKVTPSHLRMIREAKHLINGSELSVEAFIAGGEDLAVQLCIDIQEMFNGRCAIYNEYGPTEATVGCMIHQFDAAADVAGSVPIGKPIWNTQIYLLNEDRHPVEDGMEGDIYIAGACLARGYLNNRAGTSEKFVDNVFCPGERMYKSGDRGIRLDNGLLVYAGRMDTQIKINGYRIEISEIELALRLSEGVRDGVVLIDRDKTGQDQMVAFYTCLGETTDASTLRASLREKIPAYMIPSRLVKVPELPVGRNGKLDSELLLSVIRNNGSRYQPASSTRLEGLARKIWADVLNTPTVNTFDNFIDLGGDSIKAVMIASAFHKEGWRLNPKEILLTQTIAGILPAIEPIHVEKENEPLRGTKTLSFMDRWFFDQAFANIDHYLQSVALRLAVSLSADQWETIFNSLIRRHDSLRINISETTGMPYYNEELLSKSVSIPRYDLSGVEGPAKQDEIRRIGSLTKQAVRVRGDFPLRVALLSSGHVDGADILLICVHHLSIDAVSWRILLGQLRSALQNMTVGSPLGPSPGTATLEEWQMHLKSNTLQASAYREEIAGLLRRFELPLDLRAADWRMTYARRITFEVPREISHYIVEKADIAHKIEIEPLLVLAVARALYDYSRSAEIVIEMEHHGRLSDNINVSDTLGWFTILYPVLITGMEHPLDQQLVRMRSLLKREAGRALLFSGEGSGGQYAAQAQVRPEVRFNFLGSFGGETDNQYISVLDVDSGPDVSPENVMTANLTFDCMLMRGKLSFSLQYNSLALLAETAGLICKGVLGHLVEIVDHLKVATDVYYIACDFEAAELSDSDLSNIIDL